MAIGVNGDLTGTAPHNASVIVRGAAARAVRDGCCAQLGSGEQPKRFRGCFRVPTHEQAPITGELGPPGSFPAAGLASSTAADFKGCCFEHS